LARFAILPTVVFRFFTVFPFGIGLARPRDHRRGKVSSRLAQGL
jgi:hypothetical protein